METDKITVEEKERVWGGSESSERIWKLGMAVNKNLNITDLNTQHL